MNQSSAPGPYNHCLERDEIRLFKLAVPPSGRDGTAQLEGRVEIFKLENRKGQYRALSYRWGTPNGRTDPQILLKHGSASQFTSIPQNLYDYLITIELKPTKKTGESRWMWIDSICINQQNDREALRERGRQVACMDRIYSSASVVTIWLGAYSGADKFKNPVRWLREFLKTEPGFHPWEPEHLDAIRKDPYWCRLWIIQEICKAESLKILKVRRGSAEIRGDQLFQLLQDHPVDDQFDFPLTLLTDRDEPRSLPELMERYQGWQCSWPRDIVFALLALAHREGEEDLLRIPVDYNLHWDILHHELIRADTNRLWKTFRFSEFLHRRFRPFKTSWNVNKSNLDEEQKKETCDVIGFYVGKVEKAVSMCCNPNKELDEYARNGLGDRGIGLAGFREALESFHRDIQMIQLKTFAGPGADCFIYTDSADFKDTLYRYWIKQELDRLSEDLQSATDEDARTHMVTGLQPQETPAASRPVSININVRHMGSPTQSTDMLTRSSSAPSNQPPKTRQWFHIEHSKTPNNQLCACTGATFGREVRKGDLVFQFEDSDFALLARPRTKEEVDEEWAPYRIIGRAVIARDCCHRPEASKREIDNTSFSFRALAPGYTEMFPRVGFRMPISSLVELTRLIESVKEY